MKAFIILMLAIVYSSCKNNELEQVKVQLQNQEREIQELKDRIEQITSNHDTETLSTDNTTGAVNNPEKTNLFNQLLHPTKFVYAEINMAMSVPHISNGEVSYTDENNLFLSKIIKVEDLDLDKENQIKDQARQSVRLVRGLGGIKSIKVDLKKFDTYSQASESKNAYNYTGPDVGIVSPD